MYRIVLYSFTIIAVFCVAALAGERSVIQVQQGEAPPIAKPNYGLARVVPLPAPARPQVPGGVSVQPVISQLRKPRLIRVAPNGDLFVADTMFDAVHVLRIPPGSAKPSRGEVFASGLKQPFGIAFFPLGSNPQWVYIANSDGVVRFRYKNGDLKATGKSEQIIAGIPTTHPIPRLVSGLAQRNCEGMTVQPASGELWCVVNERDDLDHNTPFEYTTHVIAGAALIVTEDGNGTIWREAYRADAGATRGQDLYIAHCSACHQVGGEGLPGVFPPLKGSGVVNKDDAAKHMHVVLNGMQGGKAGGVLYAAAMPPFAGMLSDADIADIIDYERSSWGNHGKPVTAAQVAAERSSSQ
jgi:mono/diheme cytochrome c family protein